MDSVLQTFDRFAKDLKEILGENLHEIIIHGSYALGDFRPNQGDLDYIVVTNDDLETNNNTELFELHDDYRANRELSLHQLEGTYYPKKVLSDLESPFVGCGIGTGRSGWHTITTFHNSYMDLRVIDEKGIFLFGTGVPIYRPTEDDIRDELKADHAKWIRTAKDGTIDGIGFWCAIVHWCARTSCYLTDGWLTSKSEACRWCRENVVQSELRELFDTAESRRYPYGDHRTTSAFKSNCRMLLQYANGILSYDREI